MIVFTRFWLFLRRSEWGRLRAELLRNPETRREYERLER